MNHIFQYIATNPRHLVTIGYSVDNKLKPIHRKLDGNDREGILNAINDLKKRGIQEITVAVFRPNGTAQAFVKSFTINANESSQQLSGPPTLFPDQQPRPQPQQPMSRPMTQYINKPQPAMEPQSWKDYALKLEQEKVSKLEKELEEKRKEWKDLDQKVREFEKEMIKKDHEIEKLEAEKESKTGMNGVVEKVTASPQMMTLLAAVLGKGMGLAPGDLGLGQLQLPAGGDSGVDNSSAAQYARAIQDWLSKQEAPVQNAVFNLFVDISESKDAQILQKLNAVILASKKQDNQVHFHAKAN